MNAADQAFANEIMRVSTDGARGLREGFQELACDEALRIAVAPLGYLLFCMKLWAQFLPTLSPAR